MIEALLATYAAVFVAEIVGDKLLYTTGVLATRFRWSSVIAGMSLAFMAMVTKGGLAVTLGAAARAWIAKHVSPRRLRYAAVAAIVVLGALCVLEIMGILVD